MNSRTIAATTTGLYSTHGTRGYFELHLPLATEHLLEHEIPALQRMLGPAGFQQHFRSYVSQLDMVLDPGVYDVVIRELEATAKHAWRKVVHGRLTAWDTANAERAQRFASFRPHMPNTWHMSKNVHFADTVEKTGFTELELGVVTRLADRTGIREKGAPTINKPLHAHLNGGSGGVAFFYALADDGRVETVVYAKSTARGGATGNDYRWNGAGDLIAGPPKLEHIANNPHLLRSEQLVLQVRQNTLEQPGASASWARLLPPATTVETTVVDRAHRLAAATTEYRTALDALAASGSSARPAKALRAPATALVSAVRTLRDLGADVTAARAKGASGVPAAVRSLHEGLHPAGTGSDGDRAPDGSEATLHMGTLMTAWEAGQEPAARAVATALRAPAETGTPAPDRESVRTGLPGAGREGPEPGAEIRAAVRTYGLQDLPRELVATAYQTYSGLRPQPLRLDPVEDRHDHAERGADVRALVESVLAAQHDDAAIAGLDGLPPRSVEEIVEAEAGRLVARREGYRDTVSASDVRSAAALHGDAAFRTTLTSLVTRRLQQFESGPLEVDADTLVGLFKDLAPGERRTRDIEALASSIATAYADTYGLVPAGGAERPALYEEFGPAVLPRKVKEHEYDPATVANSDKDARLSRLNPLWHRLEDFPPSLLENVEGRWLYTVDTEGQVFIGSEDLESVAGHSELHRLWEGMRDKDPELTWSRFKNSLADLGVPTVAADFEPGTGVTRVGRSRVSGELLHNPLTGQWEIDASSRYMGREVRPGYGDEEIGAWLRNAAAKMSAILGVPLDAVAPDEPRLGKHVGVSGTGTAELDARFGPLAEPKKVKGDERDLHGGDVRAVRLNPLWHRLEDFEPAYLKRTSGVWHFTVDEDGEINLGSERPLSILSDEEWSRLAEGMMAKDSTLTEDLLKEVLTLQGHPTVVAGFPEDGRTLLRPARVSGELSFNAETDRWEATDKSGRHMSEKVRPGLRPDQAHQWLASVADVMTERLGVTISPVLFKTSRPAPPATGLASIDEVSEPAESTTDRHGLGRAPRADLADLLLGVADQPNAATAPPHRLLAQALRERTGELWAQHGTDGTVLSLDTRRLEQNALRQIAGWAENTLRSDLEQTGTEPDAVIREQLAAYEAFRSARGPLTGDPGALLARVVGDLGAVRALIDTEGSLPALRPPVVRTPRDLASVEHLLHRLSGELGTRLRLDVRLPDGVWHTRWTDPDGRVHAFDPLAERAPGTAGLSARRAQEAGLLSPEQRTLVDDLGLDDRELAEIYRSSWQTGHTFDEAVRLETASRHERLAVLDPRLPALLPRVRAELAARGLGEPSREPAGTTGEGIPATGTGPRHPLAELLTVVRTQVSPERETLLPLVDTATALLSPAAVRPDSAAAAPGNWPAIKRLTDESSFVRGEFDTRAEVIWLPGADQAMREQVAGYSDPHHVLVFTPAARPDTADGFGVPVDQVATFLAVQAPGKTPVLMAANSDVLAVRLARHLGRPVIASRFGVTADPARGSLSERPDPDGIRQDTGPRLYTPEEVRGDDLPLDAGVGQELRVEPWQAADGSLPGDGGPTPRSLVLGDAIDIAPAVRATGVPRSQLPHVAQVVRQLRDLVEEQGLTVEESVWTLLPHRLLSNYRYLLSTPDESSLPGSERRGGLVVPLGPAEALITLNPTAPRTVPDPAGSYDRPLAENTGPDAPGGARPEPVAQPPRLESIPEGGEGTSEAADGTPARDNAESRPQERLFGTREDSSRRFRANQTIKGTYFTGAHAQTHAGNTSATRLGVSATYNVGLLPMGPNGLYGGLRLSGTANASSRSTTHIADAEGGHIEVSDAESRLLAFEAEWSVKLRTDRTQQWADTPPTEIRTTGDERLMLFVPEHYLKDPGFHVMATGEDVLRDRLPQWHFASGLTGMPTLLDMVVSGLDSRGIELPLGSTGRNELIQKLWNLDAHLDEAVNKPNGYSFEIRADGRTVLVELQSQRLPGAVPVGATTDKAPVENVRTAIDGGGGSHTLSQTSGVTPLVAGANLGLTDHVTALSISTEVGFSGSTSDTISSGRNGLWVLVPRFVGYTAAYEVGFQHTVRVTPRGMDSVESGPVRDQGLVRMPEPEAFRHGFPVVVEALKPEHADRAVESPVSDSGSPVHSIPYTDDALRRTGRREGDSLERALPSYIKEGKGIGMGLVALAPGTVESIRGQLHDELVHQGFLPADSATALSQSHWYSDHTELESLLDNVRLFDKLVSDRGLESHYDQVHQSGLSFTLFRRTRHFTSDAARVTIKATRSEGDADTYRGSTDNYAAVNLAMGMGTAGQGVGGSRRASLSFRVRTAHDLLRGGALGIDLFRQVGASQEVSYLHNRPELLEYRGLLHEHELYSDYTVTVEYEHGGLRGMVNPGARNPAPITLHRQQAVTQLLPLGDDSDPGLHRSDHTSPDVLKHGVVFFLDASGLHEAATGITGDLTGPQGNADQELRSFTSTILVRAFAKEIFNGQYTSDQFFDSGLMRDTFASVDISGNMGVSRFAGATDHPFVLGVIHLAMGQVRSADTHGRGVAVPAVSVTAGGPLNTGSHDPGSLQGGLDINHSRQHNTREQGGRTGAKEYIQLDFNRAYAFRTTADFAVRSRLEKHGKLMPADHVSAQESVGDRTMLFLVPEPEALDLYGQGELPLPDRQLSDVLHRWGAEELTLRGDTVAAVLTRWAKETPQLPAALSDRPGTSREELAELLAGLHRDGALVIHDDAVRDAFGRQFDLRLSEAHDPYADLTFPEYLTREDPSGRTLGHSGVRDLVHHDGRTTYDIVRTHVDKVAPGLFSQAEVWVGDGRRIGRMQGGVNTLQALLAKGRDLSFMDDLLHREGWKLYFVSPERGRWGWLLAGVVEVEMKSLLTSAPRVIDFIPRTGLENYGHNYRENWSGVSHDRGASANLARLGGGESHSSHGARLGVGTGLHQGVTRAETATAEQTVYDWTGHYRVEVDESFTVNVRRLDMARRPLNNFVTALLHHDDPVGPEGSGETVPGVLELQIPRGLAEHKPFFGPRPAPDLRPLPELPNDAYISGAMVDDALPAVRELLVRMFGKNADGLTTRTALPVSQLFSRTQIGNHLRDAVVGKRDLLDANLFVPGDSRRRARLWLTGDLFDFEVIGPVQNTGAGRYSKHQSGTSHSSSQDKPRLTEALSDSGADTLHVGENRVNTMTPGTDTEQSRTTGASGSATGTENYRREEHVKQQGPVLLTRLRFRGQLLGERFNRHLFRSDTAKGEYRSRTFTGDVYAEVFEGEVAELQRRFAASEHLADTELAPWWELRAAQDFAPEDVHALDLTDLIVDAARLPHATPPRMHELIADSVRQAEGGVPRHMLLSFDQEALHRRALAETYRWAVQTLTPLVGEARSTDPTFEEPRFLGRYRNYLAADPSGLAPRAGESFEETVTDVIRRVNEAREQISGDARLGPVELPALLGAVALDHHQLLRGVAQELGTHLRADLTLAGSTRQVSRWVEPSGRIHVFDPLTPATAGPDGLTSAQAENAGLVTPQERAAADLLGLDDQEWGALYGTATRTGANFAELLREEVDSRRATLASVDPTLLDALDRTPDEVRPEDSGEALETLRDLARGLPFSRSGRDEAAQFVLDRLLPEQTVAGDDAQTHDAVPAQEADTAPPAQETLSLADRTAMALLAGPPHASDPAPADGDSFAVADGTATPRPTTPHQVPVEPTAYSSDSPADRTPPTRLAERSSADGVETGDSDVAADGTGPDDMARASAVFDVLTRSNTEAAVAPPRDHTRALDSGADYPLSSVPSWERQSAAFGGHVATAQPYAQSISSHGRSQPGLDYRTDRHGRMQTPVTGLITAEFTTYTGTVPAEAPPGIRGASAPWNHTGQTPFFVAADLGPHGVTMSTPQGLRAYTAEQFADHLAADTALATHPAGPIVLLIPHAAANGMYLPRIIAARTGRTVWAPDGALALIPQATQGLHPDGRGMNTWIVVSRPDLNTPPSRWLGSTPDILADNPDGEPHHQLPTLDGHVQASELASYTLVDENGTHLGRAGFSPSDFLVRLPGFMKLNEQTTYGIGKTRRDSSSGMIMMDATDNVEFRLSWKDGRQGTDPYIETRHGTNQYVEAYDVRGNRHRLTGAGLGQMLKRRPSLQFNRNREIVLVICNAGTPDPDGVIIGQQVADTTGRTVHAPAGITSTDLALVEVGDWHTFHPRTETQPQRELPPSPRPPRPLPQPPRSLPLPPQARPRPPADVPGAGHPVNSAPSRDWRMPGTSSGHGISTSQPAAFGGHVVAAAQPYTQSISSHGGTQPGLDYRTDRHGRMQAPLTGLITAEFATYAGTVPAEAPPGIRGIGAPWNHTGQTPFFVAADLGPLGVTMSTPQGLRAYTAEQFADHLAADTALATHPAGPIVLLIPHAAANGMYLPRIIAARTGRTVWAPDGALALIPQATQGLHPDGRGMNTWIVVSRPDLNTPPSRWLGSTPDILADNPDGEPHHQLPTLDGHVQASELASYTLVDENGTHLGRAGFSPSGLLKRIPGFRNLDKKTEYRTAVYRRDSSGKIVLRITDDAPQSFPWKKNENKGTPYYVEKDGTGAYVESYDKNGNLHRLAGEGLGHMLKRRPSLQFNRNREIVLVICKSGSPGPDGVIIGQQVADITGRTVYAPSGVVGADLALTEPGGWQTFRPRTGPRPQTHRPLPQPPPRPLPQPQRSLPQPPQARPRPPAYGPGTGYPVNSAPSRNWHMPAVGNDGPSASAGQLDVFGGHMATAQPYTQPIGDHEGNDAGLDYRTDRNGETQEPVTGLITSGFVTLRGAVPPLAPPGIPSVDAPWVRPGQTPFFIAARLSPRGGVRTATPHGRLIYSPEEFADHLAADTTLAAHPAGPIVLLIPHAAANGMYLPRIIAARTGRAVWAPDGGLALVPQATQGVQPDGRGLNTLIVLRRPNADIPLSRWLESTPDILADNPHGEPHYRIRTLDGHVEAPEIASYTIVDENGIHLGRAIFSPSELIKRISGFPDLDKQTGYFTAEKFQESDGSTSLIQTGDVENPHPWKVDGNGARPYYANLHGANTHVIVSDRHGIPHNATGDGLGHLLKRRPSLQLDRNREIVLVICNSGTPGPDGVIIGQQVADVTGRTVHAPVGKIGADLTMLEAGGWRTFHPRTAAQPQRRLPQPPRSLPQPPQARPRPHTDAPGTPANSAPARDWRMPGTRPTLASGPSPSLTEASRPSEAALDAAVLSQWVVGRDSVTVGVDYRHHGDGRLADRMGSPITEEFLLYDSPRLPYEVPAEVTWGRPAPWGTDMPVMVIADRSASGVKVTSRGVQRDLSFVKFAEHVRKVIEFGAFPTEAPIVLVMPYAAAGRMELPRTLAAVTGRDVWAGDGPMALVSQEGDHRAPRTWIVQHAPTGVAVSRWIVSRPGALSPFAERPERIRLTAITGESFPASQILTHVLVNESGEPIGQAVETHRSWLQTGSESRELTTARSCQTGTTDTSEQGNPALVAGPDVPSRPLPWVQAGEQFTPYFFTAHGAKDEIDMVIHPGQVLRMPPEQVARVLAEVPLVTGRPYASIVLIVCYSGYGGNDPYSSPAQQVANITGRTVHAPWTAVTNALTLVEGVAGQDGQWFTYHPRQAAPRPWIGHPRQPLPPQGSVAAPSRGYVRSGTGHSGGWAASASHSGPSAFSGHAPTAAVNSQWIRGHGSAIVGLDYRHDPQGRLVPWARPPLTTDVITWTEERLDPVLPSDPYGVEPAPWGDEVPPIIVAADRRLHTVAVASPGGPRELSFEGFAQHVQNAVSAHAFPEDAPIVLVMPYAADGRMELPRMLADITGREVWASDGPITFRPEGGQRTWIVLHAAEGVTVSRWILSRPGALSASTEQPERLHLAAIDGTRFRLSDVVTRPVINLQGEPIGEFLDSPREWPWKEPVTRWASQERTYRAGEAYRLPNGDFRVRPREDSPTWELPWVRERSTPYFLFAHGDRDIAQFSYRGGQDLMVNGPVFSQALAQVPLITRRPDASIVLVMCETALGPEGNPYTGLAQHVANITQRTVHAPIGQVGAAVNVVSGPIDAPAGLWLTFRPRPDLSWSASGHPQ
ncbi:hypothetical protein [Streptomyces sp. NPDC056160]|uniref:hypothetical protein n=1 Tax=Streptomyces sp. NPDC056160 TaxID=3345731 RepID=UPI0035DB1384